MDNDMQEDASPNFSPNLTKAVLEPAATGCGLGCLAVIGLGVLAFYMGFSFPWFNIVPSGGIVTFLVVLLTAIVFKARDRPAPWRLFLAEIGVTALLWVGFSVWNAPRTACKIYFSNQIPAGVIIHRAYYIQAGQDGLIWIHFSAPPQVIISLIKSNDMTQSKDRDDSPASLEPSWWKPLSMSKPALFSRVHGGVNENTYVWGIEAWINDTTNEVFGFIF